jgi:hypothetical protein
MNNLRFLLATTCFIFALSLWASSTFAQQYRLPLSECNNYGGCYITAYYDLNRSGGVTRDWNCKYKTYDQHTGTDYGIGGFAGMDSNGSRPIVAAAPGVVIATADGYYDRQTSVQGNQHCGAATSCGNYVQIQHDDKKKTIYCHMKKGTVKVSKGQRVSCGQELGRVGSSGCSTGPHLHFGVNVPNYGNDDPYKATPGCGGSLTYWVSQGAYLGLPAPTCECTPNCSGKSCGPNGCGGSCGNCPANHNCNSSGQCICQPQCSGKNCGPNGCGGSCGTCPANHLCSAGQCVCQVQCSGKACGDDACGGTCGTCPATHTCSAGQCVCKPNCDGKECGPDNCGGTCGSCYTGFECVDAQCKCQPNCEGKNCGGDGCGGLCGTCSEGSSCIKGSCSCIPDCNGKYCGSDGCEGSCGSCETGESCVDGFCRPCKPYCKNKTCGDDACGGSCGECEDGLGCNAEGQCVCVPQCAENSCADNGCGGVCGTCPQGSDCNEDGVCIDSESGEEVDVIIEEGELADVMLIAHSCGCQIHHRTRLPAKFAFFLALMLSMLLVLRRRSGYQQR